MDKFYYGAHYSIVPSILYAFKTLKKNKGNILQIFISNPQGRGIKNRSDDEINEIKQYMKKHKMKLVFHAPYILNFAREFNKNNWWIKDMIKELNMVSKLGAIGSVLHMGKSKELSKEKALNNMYKSLVYVLDNSPEDSNIILETSTGQGSELCYEVEELGKFFKQINKYSKRVKICIDTCHIFAAGYDIRTKKGCNDYIKKFDKYIGIENIALIQLNDAEKQLGSHLDRHDNIGEGYIGLEGINYFIKFGMKHNIPIILETPYNENIDELDYIRKISYNI